MLKRRLRILAVQVVVALVVFEVCLQIYNPLPFRVRGDRIVLPVNASYTFQNPGPKLDPVVRHSKNSLGFRGPEPPRDLEARLSVVTIGGSTTECLFLSDGKTWTDALAARLASTFPGIWVNNAGLDGQSTFGHLILLEQAIVPLRPKVVLFLIGINDMGLARDNRYDEKLAPASGVLRRIGAFATAHIELLGIAQNLWRAARARQQGFGHTEIALDAWPVLPMDQAAMAARVREYEPTLDAYARRLEHIIETCRRAGIEPVFVTQPALFGDGVDPTTGVDLASLDVYGRGSGELEWRLLELTNGATRRVAVSRDVLVVDLARELPKDSRLYYDLMHFSNAGAARVGDIVAARLEPFLEERFSVRRPNLE